MAIEKVVNVKVVDNVEATTKNVANLKTQLRQAQNEVNELSAKFGATSKQAVEAAKRAAELKDAIGDAKALTDAFNPDAKFKALTSTLGGVAGGFAAVQGAVGLLGSESQSVEKAILKVQSAMAISQGVQAIGESVDSFKQLGAVIKSTTIFQKALSAATAIQTFVTNGATLAAKLLRGALISTGIGALVVGVGLLIANFDKVKKVVMTLIPGLSAVGDVVMSIVNTVTDFIGVTSEAGRSIDKMVADSEKTLRKNQDFLDTQGDKYDEYTKRKIQANIDYAAKVKEVAEDETRTEDEKLKYLKDLRDKADREIFQADKDRQAEKDKKVKEEQDKRNEAAKKLRDEAKDKAKKDAEDLANAKRQQLENTKALENEITQAIGDAQDKNAEMFMSAQEVEERAINDKYFRIKELAIQQGKDINDIEIQQMNEINDVRLAYQATKKEQDDKIKEEDIAREQAVADAKLAIQNAQLDNVSAGINLLKDLGIKNKAIQKGLLIAENAAGIAKIIINTMAGNAKAVAASPLTGGMPFVAVNSIGAGIGIASSIAATAKGLAALGGGGSTGGGSMPSGGSMSTPPQFNIVGQSGTNQLAQTIAGQQNRPIEAFVVSSAVTTSQALDRNRVKTATFGG
jgi:hypothetical protein